MVDGNGSHPVAGWLAFTMFLGAAWNDATATQRQELQRHLNPALTQLKQDDLNAEQVRYLLRTILVYTQTIMGPSWEPTGEWMAVIQAMLKG